MSGRVTASLERIGEDGRLHIPIQLRWGDLDAFNHVNNTAMLKLLEEARVRAFWKPAPGESAPPTAILDSGLSFGMLTLIARQEIEYLAPVPYQRHPLDIQMWFGKLGGSSLEVCYEVHADAAAEQQALYARATTVMVLVDAASGRPVRLTPEMRTAWEPLVGEPLTYRRR
ncbi:thioesterase family protein [Microbacterium sp. ARD32]|uniref:acyl-CoA thioesterase n=1 Tax=Microbacterium sp. ARD32 TaxID=2962577 RepID=UPI0028827F8D|nr:thioesterase family protein [Microbacterium sp. ARD32]MDT0157339.1 thioesterase family protein [Microbacterium sp. ARD32]